MRIRLSDILDMLANGASRAEIFRDYPYLEDEDFRRRPTMPHAQATTR
jgi:uncharacterized protein (DUF433 family)